METLEVTKGFSILVHMVQVEGFVARLVKK